jgi:hypothetical protein
MYARGKELTFHGAQGGLPMSTFERVATLSSDCMNVRGRKAGCPAPPAQIRTSPIKAFGLYGARVVKELDAYFFPSWLRLFERGLRVFFRLECRSPSVPQLCAGGWSQSSTNDPRGACHWCAIDAPRACIRLDLKILTMKQSFASAAKLRGGGSILLAALLP